MASSTPQTAVLQITTTEADTAQFHALDFCQTNDCRLTKGRVFNGEILPGGDKQFAPSDASTITVPPTGNSLTELVGSAIIPKLAYVVKPDTA